VREVRRLSASAVPSEAGKENVRRAVFAASLDAGQGSNKSGLLSSITALASVII
jgi:hypothetical protein